MPSYLKQLSVFILIIVLGLALRLVWLDRIPSAVGGDELVYLLEAKSIALTGKDLTGTWNPLSVFLFKYPPGEMQAELPYFINLPVVGTVKFSLFSARISSAILSVLTIAGLYLLVRALFNTQIALAVGFIGAINPWSIYMGRTAYDMVPAVCFYMWAMYIMVANKGKFFMWSLPLYILAFYSYIGTKVIFLPVIFITGFYVMKKYPLHIKKIHMAVYMLAALAFVGFFVLSIFAASNTTRVGEIIHLGDPIISQTVDSIRKSSIRSVLVDAYVNKYSVVLNIILVKLFRILSFDYLFTYGDKFFSIYTHGFFYFLDAIFAITGVIMMYVKQKKKMMFISALVLVGTIPHLIHGAATDDFSPHIVMMFPFVMMFIGYGIYEIIRMVQLRYRMLLTAIVLILYGVSLGNFLQIYWFQHPLSGQFDFPVRTMSKYVQMQSHERRVFVFAPRTTDIYKKYLFYSDSIHTSTLSSIRAALATNKVQIDNISFLGCDAKLTIPDDTTVVYNSECGSLPVLNNFLKLTRLKDGGQEFRIYNDTVCKAYQLKPYPSNFMIKDLAIEEMNTQTFCETYVAR
jgi:4-amino-4-deoxy-L-arabinose transferase-like glycosyltransferase